MKKLTARRKLLYTLVLFALALLTANILQTSADEDSTKPKIIYPSVSEVESNFNLAIAEFALLDNWVKKTKLGKNSTDSVSYYFKITLPTEISTLEFLSAVNRNCSRQHIAVTSDEHDINGRCEIKIFSGGLMKLYAKIIRSNENTRTSGAFAFVLEGAGQLSQEDLTALLETPFKFSLMLTPSESSSNLKDVIASFGKKYCLLLDDEISEEIFELDNGFPKRRLQNSVINIVNNFGNATHYFVNKNSNLFNSTSYSFIAGEFSDRNRSLTVFNEIKKMETESNEDLISLFDFYYGSLGKKGETLFILSCRDYLSLQYKIEEAVKKGLKIISPAEL